MGNGGSERLGLCLEIRASVSEPCCSQPQALLLCQWLNADLSQASLFLLPGAWVSEKNSPKDARGDCSKRLKLSRKQLPREHIRENCTAIFLIQALWLHAFQGTAVSLSAQLTLELMTR